MSDVTLMQGDCLDRMPEIPAGSVDLILADLPYGRTQCKWDSIIPLEPLWEQYRRILKQGGVIALTGCQPFTAALVMSNPAWFKYEWIWEKGNATGFLAAKKAPLRAHESVLIFCAGQPRYNPQITHGHARKTTKRAPVGSECYGEGNKLTEYDSTSRYPRTVQFFSSDKQRGGVHPTQKPVKLMEYMILTYTEPGATVLDNAMGSGTTGVACIKTGRKFIGIEKYPVIFDTAERRIQGARELAAA